MHFTSSHRDNSLFSLKKKCIEHLECARLCVEVNKVIFLGFPGGSVVKNLPASAGDTGLIPGLGRSPGKGNGNALQYSCLENSLDRGAWRATVHGVAKSWILPGD